MTKEELREEVWELLESHNIARFPGARGRIPNFKGAEKCAEILGSLEPWKLAEAIKANPDSPQRALRHLALKEGKVVYMAVPRLSDAACFIELDPRRLGRDIYAASSIKGAFKFGRQVTLRKMRPIDLILCGSVAARRDGARLGKGGGYSDLEFAIALQSGLIAKNTPIITSIHPLQLVRRKIPLRPHDIPVDYIITPEEIIECNSEYPRPDGIYWEFLQPEQLEAIPVLKRIGIH